MTIKVSRKVLVGLAALLVVGGVGVGAFFIGRSTRDLRASYRRGYSVGHTAGQTAGVSVGRAEGEASVEAKRKEGESLAKNLGKAEGRLEGLKQGDKAGNNESFEGYAGGWEVGSWYLIKIGTGSEVGLSGKYSIPTRVGPMKIGKAYSLCEGGICSEG